MTSDPVAINQDAVRVPRIGLPALFLMFLRFGCFAFGGPVAQIAMVRAALVDERRWVSPARFNRLLAVMQALPGPEAHELCVHMGMIARGRVGGLLAGLGFMLPGLMLMLVVAHFYRDWLMDNPAVAPLLFGMQLVVLVIVARAVQRIGSHMLVDRLAWVLAGGAVLATLAGVPFWLPLIAAGLIYAAAPRPMLAAAIGVAAFLLCWLTAGTPTLALPPLTSASPEPATMLALFVAGLKGGLLTFGGAYTAIPFVRADTVERGWLSDASFLDGVGFANVLPAPLVIFATFAGYLAGGLPGALAITAGMFLPAFAFSMIFFERLEAIVDHPELQRLLTGVAAAVVGVIAATLVGLADAAAARADDIWATLLIVGVSVPLVWRLRGLWIAPALIVAGAVAGWVLRP